MSLVNAYIQNSDSSSATEEQEMKLVIADRDAGSIIGKGGASINAVQTDSGARIRVSRKGEYVFGERIVNISGNLEQILKAGFAIIGLLQKGQASTASHISSHNSSNSRHNHSSNDRHSQHGYSVGNAMYGSRNGMRMNDYEHGRGGRGLDMNMNMDMNMGMHMGTNLPTISPLEQTRGIPADQNQRALYQMQTGTSPLAPQSRSGGGSDFGLVTITLEIDDSAAGNVIGKRGATVTQIQAMTGGTPPT